MYGKQTKIDCVFKKNLDGGEIDCKYPKAFKNCYLCSTYISNNGDIKENLKYIEHVSKRKMNFWSFLFSVLALLISSITLILKVSGYW